MTEPRKISLTDEFAAFQEHWSPRTVAAVGNYAVKAVKIEGPFVWHRHAEDDELFYVLRGGITMEYRDDGGERSVRFGPGEMLLMPRGTEHRPVADPATEILLFEREAVVNTGDAADG
jgi:mannose-6-phosphate isomerase-like protein (cupin superfamily)